MNKKRAQTWADCLGHKFFMDIASVLSFFWLRLWSDEGEKDQLLEAPRGEALSMTDFRFQIFRQRKNDLPKRLKVSKLGYKKLEGIFERFSDLERTINSFQTKRNTFKREVENDRREE